MLLVRELITPLFGILQGLIIVNWNFLSKFNSAVPNYISYDIAIHQQVPIYSTANTTWFQPYAVRYSAIRGPVLLHPSDAVAILSANGITWYQSYAVSYSAIQDPALLPAFPSQKASGVEVWCLFRYQPEQTNGQWCGSLTFIPLSAWTNCRTNTQLSGDLRSHNTHKTSL